MVNSEDLFLFIKLVWPSVMGHKYAVWTNILTSYLRYVWWHFPHTHEKRNNSSYEEKRQLSQAFHEMQKIKLENSKQILKSDKENVSFIKLEIDRYCTYKWCITKCFVIPLMFQNPLSSLCLPSSTILGRKNNYVIPWVETSGTT